MALTPVQKITQAADTAETAANVLEQIVEGDNTTTITTVGGRTIPSITKWYEDSFLTMQNFITSEADRATSEADDAATSESNANSSAVAAANSRDYAEEWANSNEDVLISVGAGGNGTNEYSAKHHSAKASGFADNASDSATNAADSESAAGGAAVDAITAKNAAQDAQAYSEEWAINPVDVPVSVAAGGDGSTTFSAKHWSVQAGAAVHVHSNKAILDGINDSGSGTIISTTERNKLAAIESGATADQNASDVPYTNATSGLSATNVQAALDEIDSDLDIAQTNISNRITSNADDDVSANTRWLDNYQVRLGTSSDLKLYHNGTSSYVENATGVLYIDNKSNGNGLVIRADNAGGVSRQMITADPDNNVSLSYAGVSRFETQATGAVVNGILNTTGDLIVGGNLTIQGSTTLIDSNTVNIGDNIIVLNADETVAPTQDGGIEVERGTSSNVSLLWKEASDYWSFGSQKLGDVANPTAGSHVGDRDYNDSRYLELSVYTDGGVLAKVKNVDGTGSGLDADLLDGVEATGFLRTGVAGTKTAGDLKFNDNVQQVYGTDSDVIFRFGGTNQVIDLITATNLEIRDDSTLRFTFARSTGNFTATGNVSAYSDERLKEDWAPVIEDFVEKLSKVKSGVYRRKDTKEIQVGVSAQSLQGVLPEAVGKSEDGYLNVVYGNAALTACVELSKEIVELKKQIADLKNG